MNVTTDVKVNADLYMNQTAIHRSWKGAIFEVCGKYSNSFKKATLKSPYEKNAWKIRTPQMLTISLEWLNSKTNKKLCLKNLGERSQKRKIKKMQE